MKQFRPIVQACTEALESRLFLSAVVHQSAVKPLAKAVVKAAVKAPAAVAHPKATKTPVPVVHVTKKRSPVKATPAATAIPGAIVVGKPTASPNASPNAATAPFAPSKIQQFYGINSISFNGTAGTGAGQTIAVIDAYNDPKFVSSTSSSFSASDLHVFDQNFGLPDPPSFSVIPELGQTALPTTYNSNWALETALDVEWAHAIAPQANIVLVECASNNDSDLITAGVQAALAAGATVVSMSFGGGEETYYDSSFSSASNVTFLASTGDQGVSSTGYPSLSPYVVAVGGTSITASDSAGDYGGEVVWNTSNSDNDGTGNNGSATGGGISTTESKPSYQSSETLSGSMRGVPDVSFDADPFTGVQVLDTSQSGGGGYYKVGGTSLSSPCWAGLIAIADQGRALNGQLALGGYSTTLPRLYALPSSVFNDITSGNNTDTNQSPTPGYSAGPGYDLASGIGTPIANMLIPDLAGVGTITGRVFVDNSGNGVYGGTDTPLAGKTVYLDLNNNGVHDSNEPTATTNSAGVYTFTNQPAGGTVRLASTSIPGYVAVSPSSATIAYGAADTVNLTYFPIAFSNSTPATNFTVQTDASNTNEQILINGTLNYSVAKSVLSASTLSFNLTGAGDSLTINAINGSPAVEGITLTGALGGGTLAVIGTASGNDAFAVTSNSISFNAVPISFSNVSLLTLNPGGGTDSLVVSTGSVSIAAPPAGQGILTRNFSNLNIASGAAASFATAAHTDRQLVEVGSLSVIGQLDLGGNDMIVHNGNLASITSLLATGYAGGNWNGTGIASAAAHSDTTHLTALGSMQSMGNSFDGIATSSSDVLIKFTYYGDTNLDGQVDGTDYSRIDVGYLTAATGWANGDFNYDNHIDGSDYTLIDNAFNSQGNAM